jgi:hypothetical protein
MLPRRVVAGVAAVEEGSMSFMKRAREAAENAAEGARRAAEQASQMAAGAAAGASPAGATSMEPAAAAGPETIPAGASATAPAGPPARTTDPGTAAPPEAMLQGQVLQGLASVGKGAREAAGLARRGISTVVEKIDPGTLAEVIIKATALQEMTNKALRGKGSLYRISEVSISASIPPSVSFAIARLDDPDEQPTGLEKSSSDLVQALPADAESVLALDGTLVEAPV